MHSRTHLLFIDKSPSFSSHCSPDLWRFVQICNNTGLLPQSKSVNSVPGYKESNEELQAALVSKSLEEGRTLLNDTQDKSLAAEFDAMSENEVNLTTYFHEIFFYMFSLFLYDPRSN